MDEKRTFLNTTLQEMQAGSLRPDAESILARVEFFVKPRALLIC